MVLRVRGEARWVISAKISYFCRQRIRYRTLSLGIKRIATSRLLLCKLASGILYLFGNFYVIILLDDSLVDFFLEEDMS